MSTYMTYYITRILHVIAQCNQEIQDFIDFDEPQYDTTDKHIIHLSGGLASSSARPNYKFKWCLQAVNKKTKKVDKVITKYYQFDNPDGLVAQQFRMINRAIQVEIHKID